MRKIFSTIIFDNRQKGFPIDKKRKNNKSNLSKEKKKKITSFLHLISQTHLQKLMN